MSSPKPRYRICKSFTIESGHMLSKHRERCRFPHGHTRLIEVVVSAETLDDQDMVVDFKALKQAVEVEIERFDHAMALNADDPLRASLEEVYPESTIVFQGEDPTTEVMARRLFETISSILAAGVQITSPSGATYTIAPGRTTLERVRVGETPSSWAEYGL